MLLSRIGPIALEEPLGGSADSNVLRGVHVERNKTMAVKLLPRDLVNRPMGGDTFGDDVKQLQKLVHPNIARVYGGAVDDGQPYLAMELVKGESLRTLFDRRGRLPWETMVDVAEAICQALDYAYEQGATHRRLTPARVMIGDAGNVKLLGFDASLAGQDLIVGLRAPMELMHYLAPQEIRGKRSVGLPSNDLFSLGVILYEGLTGQLPWPAESPAALVRARQAAPAPRVSAGVLECPVWLDVLVARLLQVRREGRFTSADDARRAIVSAKSKVAAGMGAVQHAWSGRQGALAPKVDKNELSRLRKAAASAAAPKDDSPFYERAWFLSACLAALLGVGAWVMWPASEEALFAKAQPLMASDRAEDWQRAQSQYLSELLDRFPQTRYRAEIEEFQLRFAMHQAEARIRNIDRLGRKPEREIDRQFYEARREEQRGDRLAAWEKYEALVKVFEDSDELVDRAVVSLARQRIAAIRRAARSEQDAEQLTSLVQEKLDRAAELADRGELLRAREVLEGIVELYDGNREARPLVDEARERIRELRGE
jgi:serine/threonine protein kinase